MCDVYQEITAAIREKAETMLENNEVERVIGYGRDRYSGEATPLFISQSGEAEGLIFAADCSMMLAKYLLNYPDTRMAITAKPCDTRAIAVYLSEGLLKRENLRIIGINGCPGIAGNRACLECLVKNAVIADITVGKEASPVNREDAAGSTGGKPGGAAGQDGEGPAAEGDQRELEGMSPAERLNYFREEFSRCIRCYACREACYTCYCEECFVDSNQPYWLGGSTDLRDNFTYHLMRSMHMAGRCIDCGACEMACPEGIDVRALPARLSRFAAEIYQYRAGMDPEAKVLLNQFSLNDPEPGFLELGCDGND